MRIAILLVLLSLSASAEQARRYIVELTEEPAAEVAVRTGRNARRSEMDLQREAVRRQQGLLRRILKRRNVEIIHTLDTLVNAVVVRADGATARTLERLPGVKDVHRSTPMSAGMDYANTIHRVLDAWWWSGPENAGKGIKIAVIDSGIDTGHPGFDPTGFSYPPGYPLANSAADLALATAKVIVYRSYDDFFLPEQRGPPDDNMDHGTSVAMCAAGVRTAGQLGEMTGVAPRAQLGSYKVFPGNWDKTESDVILHAMEDAVRDRMDILNLSLGSVPGEIPEADIVQAASNRAAAMGVLVVKSAGNSGPDVGTVGGSSEMGEGSLTIGAANHGRILSTTATVDGVKYMAWPGDMPRPEQPITAQMEDVTRLDGSDQACGELPAGSLDGLIAFILRGGCNFSVKLANALAAGAVGALLYSDDRAPTNMATGGATLPAMMISHTEGLEIKGKFPAGGTLETTLDFTAVPVFRDDHQIAGFSSRGPGAKYVIKPDLVAVGNSVLTAEPGGGQTLVSGTSFSCPIVAGAAAVLRSARPGLTPRQYMSLLANAADPMRNPQDRMIDVMEQGGGWLNLARSMKAALTASPVSVSFGANPAGVVERRVLLTNTSIYPDSFTISVEPFAGGPAPTATPAAFDLARGQSRWVTFRFDATGLGPGIRQGYFVVQGSRPGSRIQLPYWLGIGDGVPVSFSKFDRDVEEKYLITPNSLQTAYIRVNDQYGIAVTDPLPDVQVQNGDGELLRVYVPHYAPEVIAMDYRLGESKDWQCLVIRINGLATTECYRFD